MFARLATALLASFFFALQVRAQDDSLYTVWSSVVFSRTGERTPAVLGSLPTLLTPLGANQSHNAGAVLRDRYLGKSSVNGVLSGPLQGLAADIIDYNQVYIGTLDLQYTAASAQAFMQGFYPPIGTKTVDNTAGQDGTLADGTIVQAPLDNYQYPIINAYDGNSSRYIYLSAESGCPANSIAASTWQQSLAAEELDAASQSTYLKVGPFLLNDVLYDGFWNSYSAWDIYDYVNYQSIHDPTIADFLDGTNYLQQLRGWSDHQLQGWYGDLNAPNNVTSTPFPARIGSISTIGGNFLASQLLGQLQLAVESNAKNNKLNLLFADFEPLMSFFALAQLPEVDPDFYGMADFASMAVFELFSYTDGSNPEFPGPEPGIPDELWVRFLFRNGTQEDLQPWPLFGMGPDATTGMTWEDFQYYMYNLVPGGDGAWCEQCQADSVFCAYWDPAFSMNANEFLASHYKVTPVVAGVIGALVALVVAGILIAALMLFGRFRVHRNYSTKNEVGGYKGSQKLASDKDLVLPVKGGTMISAEETPGSPVRGGHERVGSWELKQNEAGLPNLAAPAERRPSYEDDGHEIGEAPWVKPTEPDERV